MNKSVFNQFRQIIYDKSGISLKDGKESLVSARVGKRMRVLGISDEKDYLRHVLEDEAGDEVIHLLDVISTNVTSFFRESEHFNYLAENISQWVKDGQRKFRIWSAACSSGEEPYSIAMTLSEIPEISSCDCKILATDISTRILDSAVRGNFKSEKLSGLNRLYRAKYFQKTDSEEYTVSGKLKEMISFRRLNLSTPPFPMKGPFDCVFCRNVMIYFDDTVRKRLLDEIYGLVRPGGIFFVGHAESLAGMLSSFKSVKPSIYVKKV